WLDSHTPHGVCGLKLYEIWNRWLTTWSHPAWGVWIETPRSANGPYVVSLSHPAWGVWNETCINLCPITASKSPPARGASLETELCVAESVVYECHTPHGVCGLKHD